MGSVTGKLRRASGIPPGPIGAPSIPPSAAAARSSASPPERAATVPPDAYRNCRLVDLRSRGCMARLLLRLVAQCKPTYHDVSSPCMLTHKDERGAPHPSGP